MRGAEKFGSTEVNNQLTTIKLPSTFPLSEKPKVKTAWLVYCKTYTSIAPNNYLVSYARKQSIFFAVTLIQFDKEFEVIHYFIRSKCRLLKIFPVLIQIETHAVWGRMQNAKMTLKFSD